MFNEGEKMRIEVRENGGFVKSLLGGSNKVTARAVLRGQNERTLRNYCRVLQVKGLSKLRKEGLIEAILDFAEQNGYLAGGVNANGENSSENKPVPVNVTAIETEKALPAGPSEIEQTAKTEATHDEKGKRIEQDIENKMSAIHAKYRKAGYAEYLLELKEKCMLAAIREVCDKGYEELKTRSLVYDAYEQSKAYFAYVVRLFSSDHNRSLILSADVGVKTLPATLQPRLNLEPLNLASDDTVPEFEPEIIDVEAVEVKEYPAEICYKRGRTWPHAWIRTQQIKMFPSAFMRDESNLICNGFRG